MTRTTGNHADRVFASPLARRLARERGIDLARLHGSGPRGRIVKRDIEHIAVVEPEVERAKTTKTAEARPEPDRQRLVLSRPPAPAGLSDEQVRAMYEPGSYELVPHDTMRRVIAERLTLAKQTIPHFYLSIDCRLDALLKARKRLNAMTPQDGPRAFRISVNDFIIKALAMALQQTPRANATWTEEGLSAPSRLRHRRGGGAAGRRPVHAGRAQRRAEEPVGDLQRDARSCHEGAVEEARAA